MKYRNFKAFRLPMVAFSGVLFLAPAVTAGPGSGVSSLSYAGQQEKDRREALTAQADEAYLRGKEHYHAGNMGEAVAEFRTALDLLPEAPSSAERQVIFSDAFSIASTKYGRELAQSGSLAQARSNAQAAVAVSPSDKEARKLVKELSDPDWYYEGDDERHQADIQKVNELLDFGTGAISIGRYDEAEEAFYKVLQIDRTNTAARQGLERVENMRFNHYDSAIDHTRARAMRDIAEKWATAIPKSRTNLARPNDLATGTGDSVDVISAKLKSIIIPEASFTNVTINELVGWLRLESINLDPEGRGISFVVDDGKIAAAGDGAAPISLSLRNVPMAEFLRYATSLAGLKYRVETRAVVIVPISAADDQIITKSYRVPPYFLTLGTDAGGDGGDDSDPFASDDGGGSGLAVKGSAEDILKAQGIVFGDGASAYFNSASSQLVVLNTQRNMELVDAFIDSIQADAPKQVEVRTRFVEIRQDNLDEIGFDWMIGGFGLGNGDAIVASGGVPGNSNGIYDATQYPFASELGADAVPGAAVPPVGNQPVTAGLRSGDMGITGNALDALILGQRGAGGSLSSAPGAFAVSSVLTDPQFQVVMRYLSQKKGTDLLTAPMVIAKSSSEATVEVIRELIYPTEYDPPELPQTVGTTGTDGGEGGSASSFPVTPANPTAFEVRNTGVTLKVSPVVGPDGFTIDLNLLPEVVEFEGFVNYGSPITSAGTDALGNPIQLVITENRIDMPVFATRRASTNVTVWDGQTVAIGGLIREDVQHVQDKVPVLGDLPFIGRLFRTDAEQHLRRNMMIFVSPTLRNPDGQKVRG
ncbi:MAG: Amuc_1098 family type IV pilus outer membrane protein, partial [Verrucomicrobiota bacterium]